MPLLLPVAGVCPPDGVLYIDGACIPRSISAPIMTWMFNIEVPILSAIVVTILLRNCIKSKTLTWSILIAIASASTFWLETYGDWAQHLSYSPYLYHYVLTKPFTVPYNPSMMPLTYALYWWAHAWVILQLAGWLHRRKPKVSLGLGILLLSLPVTFLWNLIIEGWATYAGWWTYDPPFGPAIRWSNGSYWPLLWPVMLMLGWINLIAWMIRMPAEQHRPNYIERLFRVDRLLTSPRWSTNPADLTHVDTSSGNAAWQALRLLVWIVFFNLSFALTLNLPLSLMRFATGLRSQWLG
ncbi:MAG: hypothetical protein ACRYG8_46160 [Janthinobacterium lividum]